MYERFFLEGCFMTRRILSCLTGLAFAGTLFLLVGCEEQAPAPPPPIPPNPKVKEESPVPPIPKSVPKPEEPKKTSSLVPGAVNAITTATTDTVKEAMKCGREGCTQTALPTKTVVNLGKTLHFCCDDCLGEYKKANNIQ
jgi:hypothetical protein